jgi:hypothetical protein
MEDVLGEEEEDDHQLEEVSELSLRSGKRRWVFW